MANIISKVLRLVLLSGGEFPVVGLLRKKLGLKKLQEKVLIRFPALKAFDLKSLIQTARKAVLGGRKIGTLDGDADIPLSAFPKQEFLFGLQPGSRRISIGVDVWIPELERNMLVVVELPDTGTPNEVRKLAIKIAEKRVFDSPDVFGGITADPDTMFVLEFSFAEKRY